MVLEFLLRHGDRAAGADAARWDGRRHLAAMARGGMYDQLAAASPGTASTRGWVVPHFEKMLYDNALLARVYAPVAPDRRALARRVAAETATG